MNIKKIWANVAVSDPDRTRKFYTQLGFRLNEPHNSDELASLFFGEDNFIVHFFLKDVLQQNFKGTLADTESVNEIMFTIGADTREAVDKWAAAVEKAGGRLVSQPEAFGQGYYGFVFADPDGHRYNVFNM